MTRPGKSSARFAFTTCRPVRKSQLAPKVSLHSDQYSLPATYVSARLGRPIFPAKSLHELCNQHINETPDLAPLSPAEQQVLLKALAKNPGGRYPNCAAFAKALRSAVLPPTVVKRRTTLWVGLVLACGLVGGLIARFYPADSHSSPPPPPPWCPPNWSPVADAGTEVLPDGRELFKRLARTVGGEVMVAMLILPSRSSDPPPFYMLSDKISYRVFKHTWEGADKNPSSRVNWFKGLLGTDKDVIARFFPGVWQRDQRAFDGKPVLGVNAIEALLIVEELGGQVPTYDQWLKAVGANGDGSPPGPAGPPEGEGEVLSKRPLALQLEDSWPVEKPTLDVSVYGIHQLLSNGFEWCDGDSDAKRTNFLTRPSGDHPLRLTGSPFDSREVLTFARIRTKNTWSEWVSTEEQPGFRIVLRPSKEP